MLRLRFSVEGEQKTVPLSPGAEVRLGRGLDNTVVLADFSVSRRHAAIRWEEGVCFVYDLASTNGVQVNEESVDSSPIRAGDQLNIGVFELLVEDDQSDSAATRPTPPEISNATIVRPLSEFSAEFAMATQVTVPEDTVETHDGAYANRFFRFLTQLARDLIDSQEVDHVLGRMMDIAFKALHVDRGFILLEHESGDVVCEMTRFSDQVEYRPTGEVPVSKTILETVMREQVGLMTLDAQGDQRLAGGESIRIHGIRAAMCVPLWSEEKIIGFMQVDSPFQADSFKETDLDFLIALSNFGAVAVQRIRELRIRARLARYHSPAVIEEVMREDAVGPQKMDQAMGTLRKAEVTVLFGDLVGFTAFSEAAELEEVAGLLRRYFTASVEAIFAEEGTLDKFIGDCVMAFFGAPIVQDDHALRAVRAAIHIQEAVERWNLERHETGLAEIRCRVALNSGPVVVGEVGSPDLRVDYTVLGNTVNVAARLEESVARPGDIVLGESTYDLLGTEIPVEALGKFALKGLQRKISAYRVQQTREPR